MFVLFKFGHNLKSEGKSWGLEEEGQHHHELPGVTSHYLSSLSHSNGDRALDLGRQAFLRRKWKIGNRALIAQGHIHTKIFVDIKDQCCNAVRPNIPENPLFRVT